MKPYYQSQRITLYHGDARDVLAAIDAETVNAVVTDPPYPYVKRDYGYWEADEWHGIMHSVIYEIRRILVPVGSAVFILQPNSEHVGTVRPWLWDFMAWACRSWNQIQDAWWWNPTTPPTVHCQRVNGLMRPSLKACVWLGDPRCYRNQDDVLWDQSDGNRNENRSDRALRRYASSQTMRKGRCAAAADERGGVTPFNVLPLPHDSSSLGGGVYGHPASTPYNVCAWWVRYISPLDGVVLDPFVGSGTVLLAALRQGRRAIGCDIHERYLEIAANRLSQEVLPLAI